MDRLASRWGPGVTGIIRRVSDYPIYLDSASAGRRLATPFPCCGKPATGRSRPVCREHMPR